MSTPSDSNIPNQQRLAALLKEFRAIKPGTDSDRRDQLLDEMQDLVGLAGKMVMENDIIRRAEKALAN